MFSLSWQKMLSFKATGMVQNSIVETLKGHFRVSIGVSLKESAKYVESSRHQTESIVIKG